MYPALSMDEKSDDTGIISFDYKAKNLGARIKTLDIKIYRSKVHHVMDNHKRPSSLLMLMVADVNAANTGGRTEININYGKHRITCGMDYENIGKDGTRIGTMEMMGTISKNITNLWKQACIQNTGLFMQYSVPVSSFEIMAGIRGDLNYATSGDTLKLIRDGENYFDDVNSRFLNLSISAGVTEMFNSYTTLSLAAGRGTRSPNMLERYIKLLPVGYDNYDYLGNPVLDPEINNEIDITLKYNRKNTGGFQFNIFYSCVQGYISTQLLPPSVIKPQTQGVLGVKQFVNTNYVTFKGFEFNYKSPVGYKLGGNLVAAFTYGTIPSVYQYVISGSEITDRKLIKNDALPEIPPLEATVTVHYKLLQDRLVPKISIRKVAGQHHISKAYYEPSTRGFTLMHFSAEFTLNKNIRLLAGVNNIFNRAYYEHLNRKIIGTTGKLYEPGRVFFVNLNAEI